jgi:hypothetical protein
MKVEHLPGEGAPLYGGVEVLGILAEKFEIYFRVALQGALQAGHQFRRAEVDIKVKDLPHLEDGRLEALHARLGGDGGHEGRVGIPHLVDGLLGNGVPSLIP